MFRRGAVVALLLAVATALSAFGPVTPRAAAIPVASSDTTYSTFGRVFPDPQGCLHGQAGASPWAKGNVCAVQFLGWDETLAGLRYLQQRFPRYAQLVNLRDLKTTVPEFAGLDMQTAGLPTTTLGRDRKDLYVFKVTDNQSTIPLADRHRFAYSLSIHGIERAGLEGGVRAAEDLITWAATSPDKPILEPTNSGPVAGDVLKQSVLYFVLSNPDGWTRGDLAQGGVYYQRYNGDGVDLNREFPSVGYSNPVYTPFVEPEAKGYAAYLQREKRQATDKRFTGSLDLHGMLAADSFSYTLLSGTADDWQTNAHNVNMSEAIYRDAAKRLTYSALIADPEDCPGKVPVFILIAAGSLPMCPDQWGTVWDTIDYQTTGSIGDWMSTDSVGLGAIGVDNEMAFSHIAPNNVFVPEVEQLHVDGNKGIIYAQLATLMQPQAAPALTTNAAFAPSAQRKVRAASAPRADAPMPAQSSIDFQVLNGDAYEFEVKGPAQGVRNGGVSLQVTYANVASIALGGNPVELERYGRAHPGEEPGWYTVATSYLSDATYFPAGARVDLNDPEPGRYRLHRDNSRLGVTKGHISFTADNVIPQPNLAYDVANTDVFARLDPAIRPVAPASVLQHPNALNGVGAYVLADDAAPGVAPADRARWFSALKSYVQAGGTLVLTDQALSALVDLGIVGAKDLHRGVEYGGWISFTDAANASTLDKTALTKSLDRPGASTGDGAGLTLRRQTYDPGAIGFPISEKIGQSCLQSHTCSAPQTVVDPAAWTKAGGLVAGRASVTIGPDEIIGVALGELKLGQGVVRIAGGLLPTPTEAYNHPYGLDGYALSWTGWQVLANLLSTNGVAVIGDDVLPRTGGGAAGVDVAVVLIGLAIGGRLLQRRRAA
jgi:hypothetical protein